MLAASAGFVGCDNYDSDFIPEYASVVRIDHDGAQTVQVTATGLTRYDMVLKRSGHNISQPTEVEVDVMTDDEWAKYAANYDMKSYDRIPVDCYSFGADASESGARIVKFAANSDSDTLVVNLNGVKLASFEAQLKASSTDIPTMCLPLRLVKVSSGSIYSEQQNLVLVVKLAE